MSGFRPACSLVLALAAAGAVAGSRATAQQPAPPTVPAAQQAPLPLPIPGPTLAEGIKALEMAHAAAAKMGVRLSCAVVDSRGDIVAVARMDGARFQTTDVARGKAMMSAMFGQPSGNMAQFGQSPFFANLNTAAQGRLYPLQGALPIMRNKEVFGAMGCSGASAQQDEDAVRAAIGGF